ncbi:MAG: flagellar motor switch protein FliG [Pseudomonadota bacterium]|jgi:flagellar motor switch protein FliG|nr:flagellar motor switch protein FliG [Pseudomonadota bacterium]
MNSEEPQILMRQTDRAAILLLAVGMDKASNVLKQMNSREVQTIVTAMSQVNDISVSLIEEVLEEFISDSKSATPLGMNSDDYIRTVLVNALGVERASGILDRIFQSTGPSKGIDQLKWLDTRSIADIIRDEHPQIIATLLSLMEPEQAGEVMMHFPAAIRPDLLMRVATMQGIQPQALRELDLVMEKQLTGSDNVKSTALGGIDTAASILNFMDHTATELLMTEIIEVRAELAAEIQEKMFTFEDLINVDDRGMQTLLREVATGNLLLALRGVDNTLKEKIFSNMSKRAAEMLRDDLAASPPAKLADVEQSQKDILVIAKRLAEAGEISLGAGDEQLV